MILHLLMLAGQLTGSQPVVSNATVSRGTGGACSGPGVVAVQATILIAWSLSNSDAATFDIKVYENGALLQTLAGDQTSMFKTISGSVENGSVAPWTSNWVYRIDVVRKADSVVVASATTAAWQQLYGGC